MPSAFSQWAVQLGTIHLDLKSGPSTQTFDEWYDLTPAILIPEDVSSGDRDIVHSLSFLLQDEGVGFQGHYKRSIDGLWIRASLIPSDAPRSRWKRTEGRSGDRSDHLKRLFYHTKTSWAGSGEWLMARTSEDEQKMIDLYSAIPSPAEPSFSSSSEKTPRDTEVLSRLSYYEEPEGIQTRMYPYQFRSVSKMAQMEMDPDRLVDLHFTPMREAGREGTYYVNTATWDVQRHPGWYDLPRGGILCEQMGTGKTLMCLALIVATLHTPPHPPPNTLDASPILSDHTMSSYPFEPYSRAREALSHPTKSTRHGLPSLAELCATVLSKHDVSAIKSDAIPPYIASLLGWKSFYYVYPVEDPCTREAKRRLQRRRIQKVYLANTTLVVVPQILIEQWKLEMERHVVEGTLKVLQIGKEPLPDVEEMMGYDIVLMDTMRFGAEEDLHRSSLDLGPSELSRARWKRIILDEGHVAGSKTSNAMRLAISLSVERRWLVSGTPTKHLQQGGETETRKAIKSSIHSQSATSNSLVWSSRDLDDAKRIGVMIGGFLAAEPFRSEAAFQDRVTNLLRAKDGSKFGAVRRLKYIMGATMVKHAPNVIDTEASLPPSTLSYVNLRFHPMQRLTYNVLASLIASNVYTSDFKDPDYFLHPRNTNSFNMVIRNLHLACFWYSAPEMGVADCIVRTKHHLENNKTLSVQGRQVLHEAVHHLETALDTPGWDEWMTNGVSIPFKVNSADFPELIQQSWSDSMDSKPDLIDAHSLAILKNLNRPGKALQDLHHAGWESRLGKHPDILEELEKIEQKARREERKLLYGEDDMIEVKEDVKSAAHAPVSAQKFTKKDKAKLQGNTKSKKKDALDKALDEAKLNASRVIRVDTPPRDLGLRPLPTTIHTKSCSSKINHVIQSIRESDDEDKYVIFGDRFELGHVTDALDLLSIKSCYVGPGIVASKRAEVLKEFEQPDIKVCLLDLRIGARGLNLVVANRMIFLSPLWSLDVQAQAIKRVHRIGQTKPTKVDILVTEGTFEEDIAKRSSSSRSEQEEQMYSRALIENPRFVYLEDDSTRPFSVEFVPSGHMIDMSQISPAMSSPDMSPITPLGNRIIPDRVRIASPEGTGHINVRLSSPEDDMVSILKEPTDANLAEADMLTTKRRTEEDVERDGVRMKKKARVAFV